MDIDCVSRSRLAQQTGLAHICSHTCNVQHEFGNVFVCRSSGLMHVCDSTCNQRVHVDRYTMVCRISRKAFPVQTLEPIPCRKRACSVEHDVDDRDQQRIRRGFQMHIEDSMVM